MVIDARQRELRAGATRHRVMERVLAVQRHDAMGPLSGVRLALAALGRRAAAGTLSSDDLLARLATIQSSVAATVQALLSMRVWDGARGEPIGADRLLATCLGWVRPLATLAQVRLDAPCAEPAAAEGARTTTEGPAAIPGGPRRFDDVEAVDAHYTLLAALLHGLDRASVDGAVAVEPTDGGVRVRWRRATPAAPASVQEGGRDGAPSSSSAGPSSRPPATPTVISESPFPPVPLNSGEGKGEGAGKGEGDEMGEGEDAESAQRIDADGVRSLAESCGWRTTFGDDVVELHW